MSDALTFVYSRVQLEEARLRVGKATATREFVRTPTGEQLDAVTQEFGLLALAYEELLARWEAGAAE